MYQQADTSIVTMKGQIVIPKDLRKTLHLDTGTHFTVFGKEDTLVLKKVKVPSANETFEKIHRWGVQLAKEKGWKEKDVLKKIHVGRGLKGE